jgi:hypothetical protein
VCILPSTRRFVARRFRESPEDAAQIVAALRRERRDIAWLPWVVGVTYWFCWTAVLALAASKVMSTASDRLPTVALSALLVVAYVAPLPLSIWSGGLFRYWMVANAIRRRKAVEAEARG